MVATRDTGFKRALLCTPSYQQESQQRRRVPKSAQGGCQLQVFQKCAEAVPYADKPLFAGDIIVIIIKVYFSLVPI